MALTPEQIAAIANAGAGPVADLAKQAGANFALDADGVRNYGAGCVPDMLKMANVTAPPQPLPDPISSPVSNISNANPATVTVAAADYPQFTQGSIVRFTGTGSAILDNPDLTFNITSVNNVGKTFKIDADLSGEPAPLKTGTAILLSSPPVSVSDTASILTNPPPVPGKLAPQVPNGYEQAKEDGNAV